MRISVYFLTNCIAFMLTASGSVAYTRQDTLRGSNGRGRDWWDVLKYELEIHIDTATKTISGTNRITFRVISEPKDSMQIDLQEGMELLESPVYDFDYDGPRIRIYQSKREGNVYWITRHSRKIYQPGKTYTLDFRFKGKPKMAINPPWDGGFIWTKDGMGNDWISVACQGLGASAWWPCKDYQGDEPDSGIILEPKWNDRSFISNGRQPEVDTFLLEDPVTGNTLTKTFPSKRWIVKNPINTYNTTLYIGNYAHWHDTLHGEKGVLDLNFYPLSYNEEKARKLWAVTKDMLRCYEYWLGPYPFYEDGYKLVEAPFLGMEHQSAIAYGNQYKMGYRGKDRSGTGIGLSFDFIIIHESGHEWFGNSITARDIADNWIHEGFTTYLESLYAEWIKGKDAGYAYCRGEWKNIKNDRPVIGDYGVNNDGSSDRYDKGSAVVFMIRMMLNDDNKFRELLRRLNKDFYHKIVSTKDVEEYIQGFTGKDLRAFFDAYLRTTAKPVLEWHCEKRNIVYEWKNVPKDFVAPFIIQEKQCERIVCPTAGISVIEGNSKRARVKSCGYYDVVRKRK